MPGAAARRPPGLTQRRPAPSTPAHLPLVALVAARQSSKSRESWHLGSFARRARSSNALLVAAAEGRGAARWLRAGARLQKLLPPTARVAGGPDGRVVACPVYATPTAKPVADRFPRPGRGAGRRIHTHTLAASLVRGPRAVAPLPRQTCCSPARPRLVPCGCLPPSFYEQLSKWQTTQAATERRGSRT